MTTSFLKKIALLGGAITLAAIGFVSFGDTSVQAASCTKGSKYTDFTGSYSGRDTMTVQTKGGKLLCNDVDVNFASFVAPDNYNGKGFANNPTAIPQSQYYVKTITLKKGTNGKTTHTVKVPDACTNYQIDAYIGPIQTKITTSEGLVGTNAIVGKLFQRTKDDCSVPRVTVCDTKTGTIVTIDKDKAEADKDRYVDKDSDKCKVKACNTKTGLYEMVQRGKENTPPYSTDFSKCKVETCDTSTGTVVKVDKGQENTPPYSTNLDKCKTVKVCDTSTVPGKVVTVTKDVAKSDTDRFVDPDSDKCKEKEPEEIPSTGPAEIISSVAGVGSLAGAGAMYLKSRRTLYR